MSAQFQSNDFSGMNDPLGFIKKLWGDMQLPGMVTPTVSVDELDKKIQDLKTVESWLTVNMNMLKGTIQALEVQRATIATLKSMGESFAQQMQAGSASASASDSGDAGSVAAEHTGQHIRPEWPMPAANAHATSEMASKAGDPQDDEEAEDSEEDDLVDADTAPPDVPDASGGKTSKPRKTDKAADTATSFGSPAAWWELLQDQFKQAVSQAMKSDQQLSKTSDSRVNSGAKPATGRASPAKKTATSKRKPAASTTRTAPTATAKKTVVAKKTGANTSAKSTSVTSRSVNKKTVTPAKKTVRKKAG